MLFSELYGAYYNAVAAILKEGLTAPVSRETITRCAREHAFGESFITIGDSLKNGDWPLLDETGRSVVKHDPTMPLTNLQKRWLKVILLDPRIRLFGVSLQELEDVTPLFRPEDISVFDRYADGDDYENEQYIARFRLILDAIKNRYPLCLTMINRHGRPLRLTAQPEVLEYSEKDDKFRVKVSGLRYGDTLNLGRLVSCVRAENVKDLPPGHSRQIESVVLEVVNERNALERVLLHFAHCAREAERLDHNRYRVSVAYDKTDETEMVIRILAFGPLVTVTAPESFRELIRKRLILQKECQKKL